MQTAENKILEVVPFFVVFLITKPLWRIGL
jgi:hypothetical protein